MNTKKQFIKCSDEATIQKLIQEGFTLVDKTNGIATFINDTNKKVQFDSKKIVYSDKLSI